MLRIIKIYLPCFVYQQIDVSPSNIDDYRINNIIIYCVSINYNFAYAYNYQNWMKIHIWLINKYGKYIYIGGERTLFLRIKGGGNHIGGTNY